MGSLFLFYLIEDNILARFKHFLFEQSLGEC